MQTLLQCLSAHEGCPRKSGLWSTRTCFPLGFDLTTGDWVTNQWGVFFSLSSSCRNNSARWHFWHIWCKFANWLLLCSSMLGLEGTHTGMSQVTLRCSPKCCLEWSVIHHSRGHFLICFFACSVCEQWHMKVCLMLSLVSVCVSTETNHR